VFGHDLKQNFSVENEREIARPPAVDFGRTESGPQQQQPEPQPQVEKQPG
jgi:LemA protein